MYIIQCNHDVIQKNGKKTSAYLFPLEEKIRTITGETEKYALYSNQTVAVDVIC